VTSPLRALAALTLTLAAGAACAQGVSLQGMLGSKALLLVGGVPHAVAPGETWQGIKVLSTSGEQAVVLIDGQRVVLRVGEAPANVGRNVPSGGGDRIALTADSRGHFFTQGSINNRPVQFMVDTGASVVALGQAEADRLGLDYKRGRMVPLGTANGMVVGWAFKIAALRIGDVVSYEVDAVVTPAAMPAALLGNSYLSRFNMRREGSQMMLTKR
jgi:aspartyl protease family protein